MGGGNRSYRIYLGLLQENLLPFYVQRWLVCHLNFTSRWGIGQESELHLRAAAALLRWHRGWSSSLQESRWASVGSSIGTFKDGLILPPLHPLPYVRQPSHSAQGHVWPDFPWERIPEGQYHRKIVLFFLTTSWDSNIYSKQDLIRIVLILDILHIHSQDFSDLSKFYWHMGHSVGACA